MIALGEENALLKKPGMSKHQGLTDPMSTGFRTWALK